MPEPKHLDLHGERLAYLDEGPATGEVLLLLHGMAGSSQTWRSVIGPLSRRYRVIAPDLLGPGTSTKPRSDSSLGACAVLLREMDILDEITFVHPKDMQDGKIAVDGNDLYIFDEADYSLHIYRSLPSA